MYSHFAAFYWKIRICWSAFIWFINTHLITTFLLLDYYMILTWLLHHTGITKLATSKSLRPFQFRSAVVTVVHTSLRPTSGPSYIPTIAPTQSYLQVSKVNVLHYRLCSIVLYCDVLYWIALNWNELNCAGLYCIVLYSTV